MRQNGKAMVLSLFAAIAAVIVLLLVLPDTDDAAALAVADAPDDVAAVVPAAPVPQALPAEPLDATADQSAAAVIPEAPPPVPEPEPVVPSMDLVRVEPDGAALVAGQAAPGTTVDVVLDGAVIGQAVADATGAFVAFVAVPPATAPRVISLVADPAGQAIPSDASVIVAPAAVSDPQTAQLPEAAVPEVPAVEPTVVAEVADAGAAVQDAGPAVTEPVTAEPAEPETVAASDPVPETATPETAAPEATAPEAVTTALAVSDIVALTDDPQVPAPSSGSPTGLTPAALAAAVANAELPQGLGAPGGADPAAVAETAAAPGSDVAVSEAIAALRAPEPDSPAVAPVILSDAAGVRLLQPAIGPGATAEVLATVALDTIAYDAAGDVQLSGRAMGGGMVRVYIDNAPVIEVPVDAAGGWASGLPDVPAGVYTMRVDQLDAAGAVISRIETPFLREERETLAATLQDQTSAPAFTVAVSTVQPGATLWAIARERYGDGVMYVKVFEANRDRIRNPDLIYPGQVFILPGTDGQ